MHRGWRGYTAQPLRSRSRGHAAVDRPRDRAGAHRVPADLQPGAPAHRSRLRRLGRSGRRRSPPSSSSGRCSRCSSTSGATCAHRAQWLSSLRNPELRSSSTRAWAGTSSWATIPIGILGLAVPGLDRGRRSATWYLIGVHADRARRRAVVGGPSAPRAIARSPTSSSRTGSSWAPRRRWRSCPASRAQGATLTAGLLLGLERDAAARFSFLLSIPAVVLSGLSAYELAVGKTPGDTGAAQIVVATILAFIPGTPRSRSSCVTS